MSTFLKRLEWFSADEPEVQVPSLSPLLDVIEFRARKSIEIKNNILNITLKNKNAKYVGTSGDILFREGDKIKAYGVLSDDGDDVEGTWWDSDNFFGDYILREFDQTSTADKHRIKLTCVDNAYILFNRVFNNQYGFESNEYWTSPGIFRSVTRLNSENENGQYLGTDQDAAVRFDIDARFVSEGGSITDYREDVSTLLNGVLSDSATTITVDDTSAFKDSGTLVIGSEHIYYGGKTSTTFTDCVRGIDDTLAEAQADNTEVYQGFPPIFLSKIWKPTYEWLQDIGQSQYTNYGDETITGGDLFFERAFVLWMDSDNEIHWIPANDTVDTTLEVGSDPLYEVSLKKSVFDAVNMVIYNVGEDMYGAGVLWYYFNPNTEVSTLKMRYQPMIELTDTLLNIEYADGASTDATYAAPGTGDSNRVFPSSYPISNWTFKQLSNNFRTQVLNESARTTLSNDSDFNNSLREAAQWLGRAESISITQALSGLRYRGRITTRGAMYNPGDVIQITDANTGVPQRKVRVLDVTFNCSKGQFSTSLEVEEDEQTVSS
jgi:hypothetical protein